VSIRSAGYYQQAAVAERPRGTSYVSLNILLSHSRSLEMTLLSTDRVRKSLLVFHCNYVCISYRLWDIQRQRMAWPWNRG